MYHLTPHLSYHSTHITTLALIERTTHIDPVVPLSTQLHLLNLFGGDESPYEPLHTVMSRNNLCSFRLGGMNIM